MTHSLLSRLVLPVLVAVTLAAGVLSLLLRFDYFRTSIAATTVLQQALRTASEGSDQFVPLLDRKRPRPSSCVSAVAAIHSAASDQGLQANSRRLNRLISLACEDYDSVVARFDQDMALGLTPDAIEILNIGEILTEIGQVDRAMDLRRTMPGISVWYVNLGRLAIERDQDESAGFAYFSLAQEVDPSFKEAKVHMYMYLCLASVRDGKSYILKEPCADFDRVKTTSLSRLLLGRTYYNKQDYRHALTPLADAIGLDRSFGEAYYWMGKTWTALGDRFAAESAYRDSIENAKSYPWSYLELAKIEVGTGCYASARSHLKTMQAINAKGAAEAADSILSEINGLSDNSTLCAQIP